MIRESWEEFERTVIPNGAGKVQRREMRRAFYAGSICLLESAAMNVSPGDEITEEDVAMMSRLHEEIDQYLLDLKQGRA